MGLQVYKTLLLVMFFDFKNKEEIIKNYLLKEYNFEISEYSNIKYKALPLPRLELKRVQINFKKSKTNLDVTDLKIYPKIFSIYNFDNFF